MASTPRRTVVAEPFDGGRWSPFGWVPLRDDDPADGRSRLDFQWGDAHVNLIRHRRDEVPETDRGLVCEMMFHHQSHTQALLVLNCRAVVAVAPPGADLVGGDASGVRAFLLEPLDRLVLHRGTWHWGPFPVAEERVDLYNVQGRRYAEDNTCADLAAAGHAVEIVTRPGPAA